MMRQFIVTFHTHLAAMRSHRSLQKMGVHAVLSPVPRKVSASCGTCVRYAAAEPHIACMDKDFDSIFELCEDNKYLQICQNED